MRAISGLDIKPSTICKAYIMMINLISEDVPKNLISNDCIKPKSYGKAYRDGRKMGHINLIADKKQDFLTAYNMAYNSINAKPCWFGKM